MLIEFFCELCHVTVHRIHSWKLQFPSRLERDFHPSFVLARETREAADGSRLQFFISFSHCFALHFPASFEDSWISAWQWMPRPKQCNGPKSRSAKEITPNRASLWSTRWGSPPRFWPFTQFWLQLGGEAVGRAVRVFLGDCTQGCWPSPVHPLAPGRSQ